MQNQDNSGLLSTLNWWTLLGCKVGYTGQSNTEYKVVYMVCARSEEYDDQTILQFLLYNTTE